MNEVVVVGVGHTDFGHFVGRGLRSLAVEAVTKALDDADLPPNRVQRVYFANAVGGGITDQEMVRGQVTLRGSALEGTPIVNVENACASGGTAIQLAWEAIRFGVLDVAVVIGVEQMTHSDKSRTMTVLRSSTDIEEIGLTADGQETHSVVMDFYAAEARHFLETTDTTIADFAGVAVKNRAHASLNPVAQYRKPQTVADVLDARAIVDPLTLPMCAPTTDGAVALVLCSATAARRLAGTGTTLLAVALTSGGGTVRRPLRSAITQVYEATGLGPSDINLVELHDAAAHAELLQYADIGLCDDGGEHKLLRSGATSLGGSTPVNTSGGLLSRGHPLGATGCAQLAELHLQLAGRAGPRQVPTPRLGLAVNAGGWLKDSYAVGVAAILAAHDL